MTVAVGSRADIPAAIVEARHLGDVGAAKLLRALYSGRIACQFVPGGAAASVIKEFVGAVGNRPAVLRICDDDGMDRGPSGFRGIARAITWARWVMVHAAAAEAWHYETAIEMAHAHKRALVIECSSTMLPEWLDLIAQAPNRPLILTILPRLGVHPVREALQ